jgi:SNF2 family DNA or RNA helicase
MQLREYQREDIEKIKQHKCFGIFNEQRTGKTPTILTAVNELNLNKILILCPKSVMQQWATEYIKWTNKQDVIVVTGSANKRTQLINSWEHGALIINYDAFKTTTRSQGCVNLILKKKPDCVIADEAHRFKNLKSKIYKAMKTLINVPYRYALTGTPAHGKPEEIFAILQWLYPNTFRSYWKFIEHFFYKFNRVLPNGRQFIEIGGFKPGAEKQLQELLTNISIQRKRAEVMQWLPQKDYQNVYLDLTKQQTKALKELKEYFETGDIITQGVLDRLIRYRQICLDPALLKLPGKSPKTEWIIQYINDYKERPIIIFSKFTKYLMLLYDTLIKKFDNNIARLIIGNTSLEKRTQYTNEFQQGKCNVLLINIDAGKEGLTLDRAENIIFTDMYPPVADIQQAEDRFVATVKEKADKPHTIIRLIMKNSYDENIYRLIQKRATAVDVLNDYMKYLKS